MDIEQPLVSIVLPTFNRARYLPQAIESCRRQTYQQWELIIVDDASADETPEIVANDTACDARIRSVRHDINQQLPKSLNHGFALARGALLTWISDDDLFRPQTLERLVMAFAERSEAGFIYADYDVIDEHGQFVQTNTAPPPQDLVFGKERVACFLYRREILTELGGYADDLFLAEDYDYLLRVLNSHFLMVPLHENLFLYRRHAASLTDVYRGRTFHAAERALLRNLPAMIWADRVKRGEALLHLASLANWQGCLGRSVRYTLFAAALAPSQAASKVITYGRKHLSK